MNLIARLNDLLGAQSAQSEALAGAVLGGLEARLRELSPDQAQRMRAAIPERLAWQQSALQAFGADCPGVADAPHGFHSGQSPAGLGGLAEAASELLARAAHTPDDLDSSFLTDLLSKLDLDPTRAPQVGELFGEYARACLPDVVTQSLAGIAPFLATGHVAALGKLW